MFNKKLKWSTLILISFFISGCGLFTGNNTEEPVIEGPAEEVEELSNQIEDTDKENQEEEPADGQVNQNLEAWMPRLDNVLYSYEGDGNEYATFTFYPQFNQEDYYQTATDNSGTTQVEIYEYSEEGIIRTFQESEIYFRDNFMEIGSFTENANEEIVLQAPIEVGTNWSGVNSEFEITAVNYEITVPAGTYETIEVTNTFEDTVIKRYYAEDIGLVSEITETEDVVITSDLENIETDVPEILSISVYVPDEQAMGMDTVEAELKLNTNDPARLAITELLSGQNTAFEEINLLPEGTVINYLFLNDNHIVEADVSSEFVDNMNAGSTGELFALYTLVNTLSQYYGTNEVLLTIDGEPYQGAHMALQEDETLIFNEDMVN